MYLVIAEKPSVSRSIAHVIGAEKRDEGYQFRGTTQIPDKDRHF